MIEMKLVELCGFARWPCTICGGRTKEVRILCKGDATAIGYGDTVLVCETCLEYGDIDAQLEKTAQHLEHMAALTRQLIGNIKVPTFAEWLERDELATAAFMLCQGGGLDKVRAFWNERLARLKGDTMSRRHCEVLEKLLAMTDEDLAALIEKRDAPTKPHLTLIQGGTEDAEDQRRNPILRGGVR
jgi:hypothetical protein